MAPMPESMPEVQAEEPAEPIDLPSAGADAPDENEIMMDAIADELQQALDQKNKKGILDAIRAIVLEELSK